MEIYVVKQGDTIQKIADSYGVSVQRIISDNNLVTPLNLVPGQALIILLPEFTYMVQAGDTLEGIAQSFGISTMEILQNNPGLLREPYLREGQVITIYFQGERGREIILNGYAYTNIRKDVLEYALLYLTYLTIFGYGFTENGELIGIDDQPLINLAYQFQTIPIMLISSITESGNFDGERASRLFHDVELQNKVITQMIMVMKEKGYLGLDVDFEYIKPEDAQAYLLFLENVTARMHENGFFVHVDLAPKTSAQQTGLLYESHNYAAIGAAADRVLVMTYEWGYTYGPPMAVAPIDQVCRVVEYAVTEIPVNKILMGLPNYGYDWILPFERGITRATAIGNAYAVEIAARNGVSIQFDETAQTPYFEYYGNNGLKHIVWFEDVRSMTAKFELMDEFLLAGGGYWNLMRPFAQNWALVNSRYKVIKYK